MDPETLQELAPDLSRAEIAAMYRFTDFLGFLQCFKHVVERLRTPEHYALATRRMLARLEEQNVRYAEVILSAGVVLWKQQEFGPIFDAVRAAAAESPVQVRWILDAIRHFGPEHAMQVARLAAEAVDQGAVAFGIGGDEVRGPAEWFGDVFRFARDAGLRLTAHAGESAGPESIRSALEIGAERIGHGIAAANDAPLMAELRDRDIPLEICITSNVATGVVESVGQHPIRRLFDAGVPIVLNTDDPGIFGSTLCGEYEVAAAHFGFSAGELASLAQNGFRYAFDYSPL